MSNLISRKSLPVLAVLAATVLCVLAFSGSWASAQSAAAASPQGKPSNSSAVSVTSVVYDYTDSTKLVQNLLRSDGYNASGQASYTTSGNVLSQINGFWYLDLRSQTTRSVYLTFSETVSGPSNPLPDGYYYAEVISRCFDINGNIISFLGVNTSDNRCSLRVNLTHGGTSYVFVMSPESKYAGTGWATVACNAVNASGSCVHWTITPTPSIQVTNATVANLYTVNPRNGKETLVGSYHNTYRIDVTNP
jgi:hypothetical protein